jgi:hypothetical protein
MSFKIHVQEIIAIIDDYLLSWMEALLIGRLAQGTPSGLGLSIHQDWTESNIHP